MKQIDLKNRFYLSLNYGISTFGTYDYRMSYMENIARNFTKKYPSYLIHKKSEDKIKAFLTDTVKAKVETFADAEAKSIAVTEVREIADLIAEYEGAEGERNSSSSFGNHPTDVPSLGSTGVELAMSMDNGASDILPINVAKPTGASGKPKIMKRSVIRVTVELEVMMETKQYLHFLQELPELFSLHEFPNLRCRVTWKQKRVSYQESLLPIEVKVVEDRKYQRWFVTLCPFGVQGGLQTCKFALQRFFGHCFHDSIIFLRYDDCRYRAVAIPG